MNIQMSLCRNSTGAVITALCWTEICVMGDMYDRYIVYVHSVGATKAGKFASISITIMKVKLTVKTKQ